MENKRFTVRIDGVAYIKNADGTILSGDAIDRLAAYEDTGLEPGEILTGKELADICAGMLALAQYQCVGTVEEFHAALRRTAEDDKAREEGRLVELPCKVGDTIYWRYLDCPKDFKEEYCTDHEGSCDCCDHRVPVAIPKALNYSMIPHIGTRVFLTRQEAEDSLKKAGEGK